MPELRPLSYSSLRTYLECPLRWKFLYVDKLPEAPRSYFSFGRTIHSVLEELVRPFLVPEAVPRKSSGAAQRRLDEWHGGGPMVEGRPDPMSKDQLLATYDRLWVKEGYGSPEEETRYRTMGENMLLRYYDQFLEERPRPVAVEEYLQSSLDGIPVHGYVDRIDLTSSGGLEVVDYKTNRDLSIQEARDSDQLAMYQVLVEHNYALPVERLTLYHLRTLTPHRTPARSAPVIAELSQKVGDVADGIRNERFDPTPGRQCERCDFRALCPEFREVPPEERLRLEALVDRFAQLRRDGEQVDEELHRVADELHGEADRLGVHRLPGRAAVAIRRRAEEWSFAPDGVRPLLELHGLVPRASRLDSQEIQRLVRDRSLDPALRKEIAQRGGRQVRWYWELDARDGND
ncbi:MAG: PD-(D/E)XK nuclease family protein [Thermoplasmata archaeon]|nr:PD-(D/E)XK nuclease family protein [Thermoplasmata archaeon]